METLKNLLDSNKNWAQKMCKTDPDFFNKLSLIQKPDYLWIGCSDSRVPANQIVDLPPGQVFVHRNIANQFLPGDMNSHSVLQYAVEILKVKHVILCGHYGCGGVIAAFSENYLGLVEHWVENIKIIKNEYSDFFENLTNKEDQINALCELNVIYQVKNICASEIIRKLWRENNVLNIHGWIYKLTDGNLIDLNLCVTNPKEINKKINEAVKNLIEKYSK